MDEQWAESAMNKGNDIIFLTSKREQYDETYNKFKRRKVKINKKVYYSH